VSWIVFNVIGVVFDCKIEGRRLGCDDHDGKFVIGGTGVTENDDGA
jgi:hypothetical protein